MYRVFEHSQVVLCVFQCMYAIHEASPQSHESYCDDPNRLLLRLDRRQLQLYNQSVFRLRVKNHQNEICHQFWYCRSFKAITFCELAMRFSLCGNKKAKYDDNVPLLIFHFSTKTTQPIKNLFLPIDSWIANYRITKCVLHLDYASKLKNSTEAIYEWNPKSIT